jgi:hypothetical protein
MRSSVSVARDGVLLPIRAATATTSTNEYAAFIRLPFFLSLRLGSIIV